MRVTKELTLCGAFTALLIGGQLALSGVSGVEIVTVLLLSFAFYFGIRRALTVATAFSLLRCFIFGFVPSVIVWYLVYYSLFVVVFAVLGKKFEREITLKKLIVTVFLATLITACFTLLDDIITPLFYGFDKETTIAYFYSSVPFMITQCVCALLTTAILLKPLITLYLKIYPM